MNAKRIEILYEDAHILVCIKPHGLPTQSRRAGTPDMESLIKNHICQSAPEKGEPYLAVIHRLDQPVKGILVFAKTPFAAKELNRQLQSHGFGKYYRAVTDGQLSHMGCPIAGDTKYNPNVHKDGGWQNICLCAYRLEFLHPKTHKNMTFHLLG